MGLLIETNLWREIIDMIVNSIVVQIWGRLLMRLIEDK